MSQRISQRVLGADKRVYQVATMRLRATSETELWETMVMEGRGCLTPLPGSVRYVEYVYDPINAQRVHAETVKMVETGQDPVLERNKPLGQWHMSPAEVSQERDLALQMFSDPRLAAEHSAELDRYYSNEGKEKGTS